MPYIDEQDHENLLAHQDNNNKLTEEVNHNIEQKRKATILSIILGCLFLLTLAALAFYIFKYTKNYVKVEASQQVIENDSLQSYKDKITSLQEQVLVIEEESIENKIIYAVQIGAFKKSDMSLFSSNLVNFKEISNKGYNKYALGNFEALSEAQEFRRKLVKLGFRDSFIASFKNDERIKIEEAN